MSFGILLLLAISRSFLDHSTVAADSLSRVEVFGSPKEFTGYDYPKPAKAPGYEYPKPLKLWKINTNLNSLQRPQPLILISNTARPYLQFIPSKPQRQSASLCANTPRPCPHTLQATFSRPVLLAPSTYPQYIHPQSIQTGLSRPMRQGQSSTAGYIYPRPTGKPFTEKPAKPIHGYHYSKPENEFLLPIKNP